MVGPVRKPVQSRLVRRLRDDDVVPASPSAIDPSRSRRCHLASRVSGRIPEVTGMAQYRRSWYVSVPAQPVYSEPGEPTLARITR